MVYYKIRLNPIHGPKGWIDDYNTPDPKNKRRTKRYKSLASAKKEYKKSSWGIPHKKKIVKVTPKGTKTVYETGRTFK